MKQYFEEQRRYLAKVITGIRTLTRETDALLAESLDVHRANVTSFNSLKRPKALSAASIDSMLRHYGFGFDLDKGLYAAKGEFCPLISLRTDHDAVDSRVEEFIECLHSQESRTLSLLKIGNEAGAFVLIWDLNEITEEGWCAVGLGLGANNSALEQFHSLIKPTDPIVMIDPDLFRTWAESSPRKSEVMAACVAALRQSNSDKLASLLDSALTSTATCSDDVSLHSHAGPTI